MQTTFPHLLDCEKISKRYYAVDGILALANFPLMLGVRIASEVERR